MAAPRNPRLRDRKREARLPAPVKVLVERLGTALRSCGHAAVLWDRLYQALEANEPEALAFIEEKIRECEEIAPQVKEQQKKDREERLWEAQALELEWWLGPAELHRKYSGRDVWMYHGTSDALMPVILQYGLQPDAEELAHGDSTPGYVYLTARYDGSGHGDAWFYAQHAARVFGGEPIVLRVIVPFDWLEPDEDDEHMRWQWRTPYAIKRIMEQGER